MNEKEINKILRQHQIFVYELPDMTSIIKTEHYYTTSKKNRIEKVDIDDVYVFVHHGDNQQWVLHKNETINFFIEYKNKIRIKKIERIIE